MHAATSEDYAFPCRSLEFPFPSLISLLTCEKTRWLLLRVQPFSIPNFTSTLFRFLFNSPGFAESLVCTPISLRSSISDRQIFYFNDTFVSTIVEPSTAIFSMFLSPPESRIKLDSSVASRHFPPVPVSWRSGLCARPLSPFPFPPSPVVLRCSLHMHAFSGVFRSIRGKPPARARSSFVARGYN